jgi:dipeptidase D
MSDNLQLLSKLEPQPLWRYFGEICSIPHCSKQEDKLRSWLKLQAEELKLPWREDSVGNIVISRPATAGMENSPGIILQSHMDMVCEKNSGSSHDFTTDPLELKVEGNILTACDTTLGADNGVGAASALALLADNSFPAGPLQALFTVDEETGLTGAQALEPGFISGDYLLNLDSEESWVLCIGCAGGKDSELTPHLSFKPGQTSSALRLTVDGLFGGHSGVDIHTGRGNAVKILTDLLSELGEVMNWQLVNFEGGTKHNAIPRSATSLLIVDDFVQAVTVIENAFQQHQEIYKQRDSALCLQIDQLETDLPRANFADSRQLVGLLTSLPHGVMEMSAAIEGLVETSSNLAIVSLSAEQQEILMSHRSSCAASLARLATRTREIARAFGVDITQGNGYPGWQPNPDSPLLARSLELYRDLFDDEPEVLSIHAGLECGLIGARFPELDMIAIGPTIRNPHTPDELVEIDSVERYWQFLCRLVEKLGSV